MPGKLAYQLREFCAAIGFGMTTLHNLRRAGRIRTIVLGGRQLITIEEAERFMREELQPRKRGGFQPGGGPGSGAEGQRRRVMRDAQRPRSDLAGLRGAQEQRKPLTRPMPHPSELAHEQSSRTTRRRGAGSVGQRNVRERR
jgi:hypothetical protein